MRTNISFHAKFVWQHALSPTWCISYKIWPKWWYLAMECWYQGWDKDISFLLLSVTSTPMKSCKIVGIREVIQFEVTSWFCRCNIMWQRAWHHNDHWRDVVVPSCQRGKNVTPNSGMSRTVVVVVVFLLRLGVCAAGNSAYSGYPVLWILRYPAHRY
jgi:hypothetical protein